MTPLDWTVVAVYFLATLLLGLLYSRRAGSSTSEYFLSGRNLPWWLAGTSMVATTFAADTPLAVTELVAKNGVAGNWLWWNFVLGGMLTTFFYARLWRRAGVMTDVEFVEFRYSGRPAAVLRVSRALWLGLFMNTIVMGWVNLAMATLLEGVFGLSRSDALFYVGISMLLTAGYSALAGLWGVAVTDAFQFIFAMAGCVALSVVVLDLPAIGGLEGLARQLPEWALGFFPAVGDAAPAAAEAGGGGTGPGAAVGTVLALTPLTFLAFVGVQWWASWYPGSEPGGGGYIAQRMMSSKDERHSLLATLWFTIAHYCVRPWPWIIVGLSTVILYPDLGPDEKRLGYVYAIRDFLPSGLRGVLVAAFFAAYMSTIATHLNWGCSYVINDCYRRFLRKDAPEKHYVAVSRVATVLLMGLSMIVTPLMDTISGAWTFIIEAGAGLGLVLLLRWYWWRINAWSEIAAMLTPLAAYGAVRMAGVEFPGSLFIIVAATTVVWIAATFLTRPVEMETLKRFFATVHPAGWWGPVASAVPGTKQDPGSGRLIVDWIVGAGAVYAALFGVGYLLFGSSALGGVLLAASVAACAVLFIRHGRK